MRVATWNINGLRARIDFLLHWLDARQPDVVGLQELKIEDAKFPRDQLAEAGYAVATHGQKSWNGVAVLTREPAEVVQVGLPGQEEFGARLLTVKTADLSFTTVYCPNGKTLEHDDYQRKLVVVRAPRRARSRASRPRRAGDHLRRLQHLSRTSGQLERGSDAGPHLSTPMPSASALGGSSTGATPICSVAFTRTCRSSAGGTTGAAPSTATWGYASTSCSALRRSSSGSKRWRPTVTTARRRTV